jgi:large subunit ribosomal protein L21
MLAVIKTGGKQYIVSPGQKIKIEKINKKEGEEITFDEVLLLQTKKEIKIGKPIVKGAKVKGKVIEHGKDKKIIVFKYRPKKRYKKKMGHRQPFSVVKVLKILE